MDNHNDINNWILPSLVTGVLGMIVYYFYITLGFGGEFSTQYLMLDFCFGCAIGFIYYAFTLT